MFRSLFQDHLQGSPFALSAPTTLQLPASSFVFAGMWSYALYLYVYPVYLSVCCAHRQVHRIHIQIEGIRPHTNKDK
jgi:peptidoglycan/LPS O-acetylase OafA/YrhL